MNLGKWKPLFYPLTLWIIYKVIAFSFGFTDWPDIATLSLIGNNSQPFITALGFGIWIGAASHKNFKFKEAVRNALMISFVIGLVELSLTVILINTAPTFVNYATSVIASSGRQYGDVPLLNLVVSTWLGGMFTVMPAAAVGYFLMEREKKGR